jgi:hypothetical protein
MPHLVQFVPLIRGEFEGGIFDHHIVKRTSMQLVGVHPWQLAASDLTE